MRLTTNLRSTEATGVTRHDLLHWTLYGGRYTTSMFALYSPKVSVWTRGTHAQLCKTIFVMCSILSVCDVSLPSACDILCHVFDAHCHVSFNQLSSPSQLLLTHSLMCIHIYILCRHIYIYPRCCLHIRGNVYASFQVHHSCFVHHCCVHHRNMCTA